MFPGALDGTHLSKVITVPVVENEPDSFNWHVSAKERERESVCVCVCLCVCLQKRERERVCV